MTRCIDVYTHMKNNNLLQQFYTQFKWEAEIVGKLPLAFFDRTVISGMGGSMIAGQTLRLLDETLHVTIHHSYKLPERYDGGALYIASSYSGNTEETIDAYKNAIEAGLLVAVVTSGGKLLELAKKHKTPYVQLPITDLEPRFTIGYQIIALLTLLGKHDVLKTLRAETAHHSQRDIEHSAQILSAAMSHKYPIIYSSEHWFPLAYIWKAAINEGMKVPCFVNTFPEENHNELEQFSSLTMSEKAKFVVIFLSHSKDHLRIQKRMNIVHKLYTRLGVSTLWVDINKSDDESMLKSLITLIAVGYAGITEAALARNVDPFKTPEIEALKKQLIH